MAEFDDVKPGDRVFIIHPSEGRPPWLEPDTVDRVLKSQAVTQGGYRVFLNNGLIRGERGPVAPFARKASKEWVELYENQELERNIGKAAHRLAQSRHRMGNASIGEKKTILDALNEFWLSMDLE